MTKRRSTKRTKKFKARVVKASLIKPAASVKAGVVMPPTIPRIAKKTANRQPFPRERVLLLTAELLLLFGVVLVAPWNQPPKEVAEGSVRSLASADIRRDLIETTSEVKAIEATEGQNGISSIDATSAKMTLAEVDKSLQRHNLKQARKDLLGVQRQMPQWNQKLASDIATKNIAEANVAAIVATATRADPHAPKLKTWQVPILIYHYTPVDFENQLIDLRSKHYTSITLDQLAAAMNGLGSLPPKPVVITYDDGYTDQLKAYNLLVRYHMKATFYIITGGQASNWCLGANRTNLSCGDASLNWNEITAMDHSGLITIGAHTVDHLNLASLSADQQWFEITQSKQELELRLGHSVRHFAYPYGSYTAETTALVRQAGFATAVTTEPGTTQTLGDNFRLHRVRSTYALP